MVNKDMKQLRLKDWWVLNVLGIGFEGLGIRFD